MLKIQKHILNLNWIYKGFDLGTLEETSPKLNMEYDEQLETSNTVLDPGRRYRSQDRWEEI